MNNNTPEIKAILENMGAGFLPEHLSRAEVNLLKEKFGDHWFEELGYYEPTYRRPRVLCSKKNYKRDSTRR